MPHVKRLRLDQLVVERGYATGRDEAKRLVIAGKIFVEGERSDKPGRTFPASSRVELAGGTNPYVSRGGLKLAGALDRFGFESLAGMRVLDIGASTGGFTDCMIQRGASSVVAVDTGKGKLHERLLRSQRVRLIENFNARAMTLESVGGEPFDLIAIDVSFISLRLILPPCVAVLKPTGDVIALVKPQFEAGKKQVGKGGVIRDREVHRAVLADLVAFAESEKWRVVAAITSPLRGAKGNLEFFIHLRRDFDTMQPNDLDLEKLLLEAESAAE